MNAQIEKRIENKIAYHNQIFELLTIDNDFKSDINKFRKKWHISVSACKKFYSKFLIKDNDNEAEEVDFSAYENTLFNNYIHYQLPNDNQRRLSEDNRVSEYQENIYELLKKYHLSFRYFYPLKKFVYENKRALITLAYIKPVYDSQLGDFNSDTLDITIYPDSNDTDICYVSEKISEWLNVKREEYRKMKRWDEKLANADDNKEISDIRFRSIKNYKLKKRVWELYNLREKNIVSVLSDEFIAIKISNEIRTYGKSKLGYSDNIFRYITKDPKYRDSDEKEIFNKSLEEKEAFSSEYNYIMIDKYIAEIKKRLGKKSSKGKYFK